MKSPKRDMGSCHVASQTLTHLDAPKVHASLVSYMKVCWQSMGWSPGTLYFMTISMRITMLNIAQLLNIFQTQLVVCKSPFPGFMGYLRGYPELSHLFATYSIYIWGTTPCYQQRFKWSLDGPHPSAETSPGCRLGRAQSSLSKQRRVHPCLRERVLAWARLTARGVSTMGGCAA